MSDLKPFLLAVEERSFTRAAKQAFLAQQGFSMSIRRLERSVGSELFVRSPKGVELTSAGRALQSHARMIVGAESEAPRSVHGVANYDPDHLVVGVVGSAGRGLISVILEMFRTHYPRTEVTIRTIRFDEIEVSLRRRTVDVLYSFKPFVVPDWSALSSYEEPMMLLVHRAHPFVGLSMTVADNIMKETVVSGSSLPAGWTEVGWLTAFGSSAPQLGGVTATDVRCPFEVNETAAAGLAAIPIPSSHRAAFPHPRVSAVALDRMTAEAIVAIPTNHTEQHWAMAALSVETLR